MKLLQELSASVASLLDPILPKNVRCVVVLVDTDSQDVCAVSDLPDDNAKFLLEEAIQALGNPGVSPDIKLNVKNDKPLN